MLLLSQFSLFIDKKDMASRFQIDEWKCMLDEKYFANGNRKNATIEGLLVEKKKQVLIILWN